MTTGIGQPVRRVEDGRLLTGQGHYSDDANLAGQAHAVVLRAPHAHALIRGIDTRAAAAAPGVLAVLTAADAGADGVNVLNHVANTADAVEPKNPSFVNRDGATPLDTKQPVLAGDKIRLVGEGVALVVAETVAQARDAAELIVVDYQPIAAVTDAMDAIAPDAPAPWESAPGNICLDAERGDETATEAAFADAAHVVEMDLVNNRIINCQMEPRAAVAEYDAAGARTTLHVGSQGANRLKMTLAATLGVKPAQIRVITRDVGGGFGPRNMLYPEYVLVAWAAKRLGRPVKWTGDRAECFLTDFQGRDLHTSAALALDADGRFRAMRVVLHSNIGAHTIAYVSLSNGSRLVTSLYDIPIGHGRFVGVLTNTAPTAPFRGAGRPEAMFVLERLIDTAAAELGIDRVELRRRNLIPADALPYTTPMGLTYDCGEFERGMDMTLALADWDGFPARRAEARARGRLRGIGLANYIEAPVGAPMERAEIRVDPAGRVDVIVGTQSQGQGHETSFAQVVSEWLGVPFDAVRVITGDTDVVKAGGGTHSDRSMRLAGFVMVESSNQIIAKGREAATELLEAATEDIVFADGRFTVEGTDRSVGIFEVAETTELDGESDFWGRIPAYPNGSAVCEVEVDPETGAIEVVAYATVDDVGRAINPMIVHGQTHGGIAMGVGQALWEDGAYDPESGQLIAGSYMDYGIARADGLPSFKVDLNEVPTEGNPLGVKGGGEGGTTPALGATINAIVDALSDYGVRDIRMPATPERIWRAMRVGSA